MSNFRLIIFEKHGPFLGPCSKEHGTQPVARRLHVDVSVQTGANKSESRGMTHLPSCLSTMNAGPNHAEVGRNSKI